MIKYLFRIYFIEICLIFDVCKQRAWDNEDDN